MCIFSATNNTLKIGKIIRKKLKKIGAEVKFFNITDRGIRLNPININQFGGLILGSPVYAWRSPKPVREWIQTLNGGSKMCAMFFTYGGIHVGAAHHDTKLLLEKQGFEVIASAEFVAKHTYNLGGWDLNVNRPNEDDFEVARQFAQIIYDRFAGEDNTISIIPNPHISENTLNKVKLSVELGVKPPRFKKDKCNSCKVCENLCPTGAIDGDNKKINRDKCIRCFRCIVNCPETALKAPDLRKQLAYTLEKNNLSKNEINTKKSKIL